jgi:arginine exporter protein ArgO
VVGEQRRRVCFCWALNAGFPGLAAFFCRPLSADFIWYTLVAVVVATGKRFIPDSIYRGVLVVCGVFLIGLAVYFIVQGWA